MKPIASALSIIEKEEGKGALTTELETIPGIGEQTVVALMKAFKSVKRISEADEKDLERVVGLSRARKIKAYYNSK